MISDDEKLGGLPLNRTWISLFRACMDNCGLMDLGFQGPRFTWTNKSSNWHHNIKEQLDRGLGNAEWKLIFLATEISHLPRVKSDHYPFCLTLTPCSRRLPSYFGLSKCGLLTLPSLLLWAIVGNHLKWFHLLPPPYLVSLDAWTF